MQPSAAGSAPVTIATPSLGDWNRRIGTLICTAAEMRHPRVAATPGDIRADRTESKRPRRAAGLTAALLLAGGAAAALYSGVVPDPTGRIVTPVSQGRVLPGPAPTIPVSHVDAPAPLPGPRPVTVEAVTAPPPVLPRIALPRHATPTVPPARISPPDDDSLAGFLEDTVAGRTIRISHGATAPAERTDRLSGIARRAGAFAVTVSRTAFAARETVARYYHIEDRDAARRLATLAGGRSADYRPFRPSPPPGTIEIHMADPDARDAP